MAILARDSKTKINKWNCIKLKSFIQWSKLLAKLKGCLLNVSIYLQTKYLIRGQFQNIQRTQKSMSKKLKNGQKTWIDIFPKKIYRWSIDPEKIPNITNHQGNRNQNHNKISPHTCQNGYYQKDNNKKSVYEDVKKKEPLLTIDGNVNWCSQHGKPYEDSSKN